MVRNCCQFKLSLPGKLNPALLLPTLYCQELRTISFAARSLARCSELWALRERATGICRTEKQQCAGRQGSCHACCGVLVVISTAYLNHKLKHAKVRLKHEDNRHRLCCKPGEAVNSCSQATPPGAPNLPPQWHAAHLLLCSICFGVLAGCWGTGACQRAGPGQVLGDRGLAWHHAARLLQERVQVARAKLIQLRKLQACDWGDLHGPWAQDSCGGHLYRLPATQDLVGSSRPAQVAASTHPGCINI